MSTTVQSAGERGAPRSTASRPFVFVPMPFDPAFDDVYAIGVKEAAAMAICSPSA